MPCPASAEPGGKCRSTSADLFPKIRRSYTGRFRSCSALRAACTADHSSVPSLNSQLPHLRRRHLLHRPNRRRRHQTNLPCRAPPHRRRSHRRSRLQCRSSHRCLLQCPDLRLRGQRRLRRRLQIQRMRHPPIPECRLRRRTSIRRSPCHCCRTPSPHDIQLPLYRRRCRPACRSCRPWSSSWTSNPKQKKARRSRTKPPRLRASGAASFPHDSRCSGLQTTHAALETYSGCSIGASAEQPLSLPTRRRGCCRSSAAPRAFASAPCARGRGATEPPLPSRPSSSRSR